MCLNGAMIPSFMGRSAQLVLALLACAVGHSDLGAATLDFSTLTPASWTVTAGGAVNATPFPFGGEISVTSTETSIGSFVPGGSFASFDGFWTAQYALFLPSGATSISLI